MGDGRLNYYGMSYGTLIGAMCADFFTSRVGLMVLDSGIAADGLDEPNAAQADVDAMARSRGRDLAAAVADFAKACGAGCSLGSDEAAVSATIVRLLDGFELRPLPTAFQTLPLRTEGWAAEGARATLARPALRRCLAQRRSGAPWVAG